MIALLERGKEGVEANTHPRAMPFGMDSSGWPACDLPSVGQSVARQGLRVLPALCQHYDLTPPVDPADHDMFKDGFGCSAEGYYPASLFCTLSFISACLSHIVTHWALSFYRYPSRELDFRCCALSSLSPTTHTTREGGNRL